MSGTLPYRKQETDYYCGPAVVQMLLARVGIVFTQKELAEKLRTNPSVGTTADAIMEVLRLHDLRAERQGGASLADIAEALAAGREVVVGYLEPEHGEPHYALVAAMDEKTITLMDPYFGERHTLPLSEFEGRWRDDGSGVYGERLLVAVSP